jgi:hypothetical protein
MPQCPICNAAIWVGERHCTTCGNYLPHPEEGDHFCPQCSIRVAPQQEICHKCKAALPGIAGTPSPASAKGWRPIFRGYGIFIGTGLIIAALLLGFLFARSPGPPQLMVTPPPQAPADLKQTPGAPPNSPAETAPSAPAAQEPTALSEPTTPSPPKVTTPTPSPLMYVVNIHYLALRNGPSLSAPQIATLNFQDEVELLETSGGWGRVRDVGRNIAGWSSMRYLEPVVSHGP